MWFTDGSARGFELFGGGARARAEREIHLFSLIINYKVLGLNTAGVAEGNAEGEAEGEALLSQSCCTSNIATCPRYLCSTLEAPGE